MTDVAQNPILRAQLPSFSNWARMRALVSRVESAPAIEWTPAELSLFSKAKDSSDPEQLLAASRLIEQRWRDSPTHARLANDISMMVACSAPLTESTSALFHPLAGSVLRAADPLAETPFAHGKAPQGDWNHTPTGDPDITQWISAKATALRTRQNHYGSEPENDKPFFAALALEQSKGLFPVHAIASSCLAKTLGPADSVLDTLETADSLRTSRAMPWPSHEFDHPSRIERHYLHLANLRVMLSHIPEATIGRKELARAVGVASDQSAPAKPSEAGFGWLWSISQRTGISWDETQAAALADACAAAFDRHAARAHPQPPQRGADNRSEQVLAQNATDAALISIWPWIETTRKGSPDRDQKISAVQHIIRYSIDTHAIDHFAFKTSEFNAIPMKVEADASITGAPNSAKYPTHVTHGDTFWSVDKNRTHRRNHYNNDVTAPDIIRQYKWVDIDHLASFGGNPNHIWTRDVKELIADAKHRAKKPAPRSKADKAAAASLSELSRHARLLPILSQELSTEALSIASAREAKWARDHGLTDAAARLDNADGSSIVLADLESECARRRVSFATNPAARLWTTLEAIQGEGSNLRADAARAAVRKTFAVLGISKADINAFALTPQAGLFIDTCAKLLDLKAQWTASKNPMARHPVQQPCIALFGALFHDSRSPTPSPALANPEASSALCKALSESLGESHHSDTANPRRNLSLSLQWLGTEVQVAGITVNGLSSIASHLTDKGALQWLHSRAVESAKQWPMMMRHAIETALESPPTDPAPTHDHVAQRALLKIYNASSDSRNNRSGGSTSLHFNRLPYCWAPEDTFLPLAEFSERLNSNSNQPKALLLRASAANFAPEVFSELDKLPFAGSFAFLAAKAGRTPEIRPEASAQSQANAWVALGKECAREWLGITEAAWKLICRHNDATQINTLLTSAERFATSEALLAKNNAAPLEHSLSRLYCAAAARNISPVAVELAHSACSTFRSNLRETSSAQWITKALRPIEEGSSLPDVLSNLASEPVRAALLSERIELAFLERAADHLTRLKATIHEPTRNDIATLSTTLNNDAQEIVDWANDWAGRFWSELPDNLTWNQLARGSKRWHDQQILQAASEGNNWTPVGLEWNSPELSISVTELTSPPLLTEEGRAMRHCVGSYADTCRSGTSRVFSIRQNGARLSTLELTPPSGTISIDGVLSPSYGLWHVKQHKGVCNQTPSADAKSAQESILESINVLWKSEYDKIQDKKAKLTQDMSTPQALEQFDFPEELDILDASKRLLDRRAPKSRSTPKSKS